MLLVQANATCARPERTHCSLKKVEHEVREDDLLCVVARVGISLPDWRRGLTVRPLDSVDGIPRGFIASIKPL